MSLIKHQLAAATAVAAAFSLAAVPAAAAELPRVAGQGQPWDAHALDAEGHGHHGGHYGHWGHDDDWHVDGDDVLAGVLILGGIAAISAIAHAGAHHDQVYHDPQRYPPPDANYQGPASDNRARAGGMGEAVDACVAEVEAGRGPVGSVDSASRSGEGWYVAGELDGGAGYACWTDEDGRVTHIEARDQGAGYDAPTDDDTAYNTVRKQAGDDAAGDGGSYEVAQAAE